MSEPMTTNSRPTITLGVLNKVKHNGNPCRVILKKNMISIGCSDITPEAAEFIFQKWKDNFGATTTVVVLDE